MAIIVATANPKTLLQAIYDMIDEGKHIDTWKYDKDRDFVHTRPQWENEAWLRATVQSGVLMFGILGVEGKALTKPVYGVYHGRFIEMLLTHFDKDFSEVTATALLEPPDLYKPLPKPAPTRS